MRRAALLLFCLLLPLLMGASGAEGPYIYSALRSGDLVSVRLCAPEGGLLAAAVYDAQSGAMTDCMVQRVEPDASVRYIPLEFERRPLTSERVTLYLLDETLAPLCQAVLSDMVVPAS